MQHMVWENILSNVSSLACFADSEGKDDSVNQSVNYLQRGL